MKSFRSIIIGMAAIASLGLGFTSCQDDIDAPAVNVPKASVEPNMTILELKTLFWDDATNYARRIVDENDPSKRFIIAGRVASSDEAGNVFKSLVIQDESAAIALSINSYNLYLDYRVGQEVVMDLTGMYIGKYNGYQQIGLPQAYQDTYEVTFMGFEYFKSHSELNGLPDPSKVDTLLVPNFSMLAATSENLPKYQSQLVRLQDVTFADGGKEKLSEYHSSGINRTVNDVNGSSMTVRTSGYCNFWNQYCPVEPVDLVGILGYFGTSGWQFTLLDAQSIIPAGEHPGTKDNPWTVEEVVGKEATGTTGMGWVKGYIAGAVAPEVETVANSGDIEWTAPTVLNNTLVIAPDKDCKDITKCLVMALPANSPLRQYGNLRDNADVLGREIKVIGTFDKYMGTYGITGNQGTADEFEIEGVTVDTGEIPDGDGQEATPYNVDQIIALNPTSTQEAVQTGVWVEGYIVGYMPTGGTSTLLSGTVFNAEGAANTNLVLGPTADCQDVSKCVGVQLPIAMRDALSLQTQPGNLGKKLAVKGDVMKYCGGPGMKNLKEYKLEGGDTPTPPTPPTPGTESEIASFLDASLTEMPADWTTEDVNLGGLDAVWSWKVYNGNGYLNASAHKEGGAVASEAYCVSPVIDLTGVSDAAANFDHAAKFQTTIRTLCTICVREAGTTAWTKLAIPTWPEAGAWTFANSGNIDLSAYNGKKIQLAFLYGSTVEGADTWEIKNLKITGKK